MTTLPDHSIHLESLETWKRTEVKLCLKLQPVTPWTWTSCLIVWSSWPSNIIVDSHQSEDDVFHIICYKLPEKKEKHAMLWLTDENILIDLDWPWLVLKRPADLQGNFPSVVGAHLLQSWLLLIGKFWLYSIWTVLFRWHFAKYNPRSFFINQPGGTF